MSKDYYKALGVDKGASADEIKKAYRKMAMKYHPDQNKGNDSAEAKFKELNEAYDVLKDDQKRAAYDQYGAAAFENGGMGGGGNPFGGGGNPFGGAQGFGGFSDVFEEMFGDVMGGGRNKQSGPRRGSDLQYTLEITLEEAYNGKEVTIKLPVNDNCDKCDGTGAAEGSKPETCPTCNGSGRQRMQQGFFTVERGCSTCGGTGKIIRDPCQKCSGTGIFRREKTLKVTIPQGIDSGQRIRLSGEGEAGINGGPHGDLYVVVAVKPHDFFRREASHLFCRVPITMTTAALGGEVEAPTIEGTRTKVKIPAGIQTGQQLRLKGKGMSLMRSKARGDMYIEITVETPVDLNRDQRDLMQKLADALGTSNSGKHSPAANGFLKKIKEVWTDLTE